MSKILIFLFCCFYTLGFAQNHTLSGYLKDASTGETLIGANIYNKENRLQGATTNTYGFYSITLPPATYILTFSYLGYQEKNIQIVLEKNQTLNIDLAPEGLAIQEVEIKAKPDDNNVQNTSMGTVDLPMDNVKKLPALMGEIDILKTLQLLPGVKSAGEGGSGFYVRGGGPDQNLILLDEATVYNSGHLLGFFSIFNADAIKNTTLIKGGMPANFGGRLSSVVDIQMKEGNNKKFGVEGGVGTISSRLTVEGPLVKDKSSFMVSGRRTYLLDLLQPVINNTNFAGTNYYFYDLNAKVNYQFSDKDRLYLSGYFGRDVLNYNSNQRDIRFRLPYGNSTATARWNHLFSNKLFMNVAAIYNDYDFSLSAGQGEFSLNVFSGVRDWNAKVDFDYFPNVAHHLKFGVNYTYHRFTPNIANATNGNETFSNNLKPNFAHEYAAYIADDYKINSLFSLNYGLRFSAFTQVGPYTTQDGKTYTSGQPVKTYTGIEPRLSAKYSLNSVSSLKASFSLTNQYVHLVTNSSSTLPADVWVPSTALVKPQTSLQYATGYFRNFDDNMFEASIEAYYKTMQNQIDYREDYVPNAANNVELQFVFGKGWSYGTEFFLRKNKGKLTGWVGYTWSRTERKFLEINNGTPFPVVYDRRHDLSVVANYPLTQKWDFGATFVYSTGNAYTPLESLYFIDNKPIINYGTRNSARIQPYHRLDISATYTPKAGQNRRFLSSWNFSVYNIYNRKNVFFTYYDFNGGRNEGNIKASAIKVTIFPMIPSITWNFKWK